MLLTAYRGPQLLHRVPKYLPSSLYYEFIISTVPVRVFERVGHREPSSWLSLLNF